MVNGRPSGRRRPRKIGGRSRSTARYRARPARRAAGSGPAGPAGSDSRRPGNRSALPPLSVTLWPVTTVDGIARNAVVAEDLGRLAGGGVDQGDPDVRHRRAVAAVEGDAERIGENVDRALRRRARRPDRRSASGSAPRRAATERRQSPAPGGPVRGQHDADEAAAIGAGLDQDDFLAVAEVRSRRRRGASRSTGCRDWRTGGRPRG